MANDRLFLRHKPSGISIMLGKHLNCGWYQGKEKGTIQNYFDYLFKNYEFREDLSKEPYEFELAYETDDSFIWDYTNTQDGWLLIKRKDNA